MKFVWKKFDELTLSELYEVLKIRQEVFVVGQNCAYLDADGLDYKSKHLLVYKNENLAGYLRVLPQGLRFPETAIGRVATGLKFRGLGIGKALMETVLVKIREEGMLPVRISAQSYLERFYSDFGFKTVSKEYLEDNIPHIEMLLEK